MSKFSQIVHDLNRQGVKDAKIKILSIKQICPDKGLIQGFFANSTFGRIADVHRKAKNPQIITLAYSAMS